MRTDPRSALTDALRAALPTSWVVQGYPSEPTAVQRVTVIVWQESVRPHPDAPAAAFDVALGVAILAGGDEPAARENQLDDALGRVLDVIDQADWLTWPDGAERTTLGNHHGYKITAHAVAKKG